MKRGGAGSLGQSEYTRLPSVFDAAPSKHTGYPDWTPEQTKIILVDIEYPGAVAAGQARSAAHHKTRSWDQARKLIAKEYGRVLEERWVGSRMFFRVFKEQR